MSATMHKEIAKKVLHPNSRKIIAIAKKTKKISNRQKTKLIGMVKQSLVGEKIMWIQQNMIPGVSPYTPELTAELLLKYIGRNDEELEQIAIKHSVGGKRGRQHANREDVIRMTKKREQEEFDTCGIEIPDILIPAQCEMLRTWNGELRFLPKFKFRRFGKVHLKNTLQKIEKQSRTCHYINLLHCLCEISLHKNSTEPCICSKANDTESSDIKNKELNSNTLLENSDAL
ncbi:translation machinery-associated protein 16 homolog [Odontomachus brunneus]|uniref:translation machinery-associated protein 16 homolog n=1 Tax=Odontomachus brunneus TaxID=486640 RepID=UPI0013F18C86|nr:translation machinery-associated protein 16 homolog [Odontomachus brunneus]